MAWRDLRASRDWFWPSPARKVRTEETTVDGHSTADVFTAHPSER